MGRYCHDSAGTVSHQYIVRYPYRDLFTVDGIGSGQTLDADTGLILCQLGTFEIRLFRSHLTICHDIIPVLDLVLVFIQYRMLRRYYHVGNTEQSIRSGGVNAQLLIFSGEGKVYFRTLGLSDPVLLGNLDTLDIIYGVQSLDQLVCIFSDLQHPLALDLTDDFGTATLADTVDYFLICQTYLTGGTPVDRHLCLVSQSCLEQL